MSSITEYAASTAFPDYNIPGLPGSGEKEPEKPEIRALFAMIDAALSAIGISGGIAVAKSTRALLNADLVWDANKMALVYADSIAENNDFYIKSGASGTGSWTKLNLIIAPALADMIADVAAAYAGIDAQVALTTSAAASAASSLALAQTARSDAQAAATGAAGSALAAAAYANAANLYKTYATKAEATADLSNIPANGWIEILVDESQGGTVTRYRKESGSLVLKLKSGQKEVRPEYFGAMADNTTDDRAAILAAKTWILANGGELVLSGAKIYYVGAPAIDLSGVLIRAEYGAALRGSVDLSVDILARSGLDITIDSAGITYLFPVPANYKKPFSEKSIWLSSADFNHDSYVLVDPATMSKEQVSWPSGDTWTTDSLPTTSGETMSWALTAGGVWHVAYRGAKGRRSLTAVFPVVDAYARGAFIRYDGGYVAVYTTGSTLTVAIKAVGVSVVQTNPTYPGMTTDTPWKPENAEWSIRVYDKQTFGVVINGTEVYRGQVPSTRIINDYGFGVLASASSVNVQLSHITERTTTAFGGQAQVALMVFGDSMTAQMTGVWTDALREALDGTQGIRVVDIVNRAVSGDNSFGQATIMQNLGLGIANYVVMFGWANDVQGGASLATTIGNQTAMFDAIDAAGRRAVMVIPPLWVNAADWTGGFATSHAEDGWIMRSALKSLAASRGALILDLQEYSGQILKALRTSPGISDQRILDAIHHRPFLRRIIGRAIAALIAGDICRKPTRAIPEMLVPSEWARNSWAMTTEAPYFSVSEEGRVFLRGVLDAGTKTDGTICLQLPAGLRPTAAGIQRFSVLTNSGNTRRVEVAADGSMKVYGLISGDSYFILDGITWVA